MCCVILRLRALLEPESLRTRWRTCAVLSRALFCSLTSLIVPGIWASQPNNLLAIAPSAPTTTRITIIFTFQSCSSSIFNDRYLSFFQAPCPSCFYLLALQCQLWGQSVLYSWSAQFKANCEADACQSRWGSPEDLGLIITNYFFWFHPSVFTVLRWPCIPLRPHCCVSQCLKSLRACCSRWLCATVSACCLNSLHLGSCTPW